MKPYLKTLAGLATILIVSLLVSYQTQETVTPTERLLITTYTTTSTRTQNVIDNCPANLDRSTLVDQEDVSAAVSQRKQVNAAIGIDGNNLIGIAVNGSVSAAIEIVKQKATNYGIYVISFLAGFVIFLLIWPFLCCCCTCPYCCPSKCCQKPEDQQYSKCQLYWPATTLILALILTMGASIYGFTKVKTFGPAISNMGCCTAIVFDDLLNGNATTDGKTFFTGLNTLNSQVNALNSSLTDMNGNFSDFRISGAGSDSDTALTNINAARDEVKQIPSTTGPSYQMTLTYQTPIDQSAGLSPADPQFKPILGHFADNSTMVGALYTILDKIGITISDTRSQATNFNSDWNSFGAEISNVQSAINSIVTSVSDINNMLKSGLSMVKLTGNNGNMGLQAYYGVLIGFSFFALLGVLLTACCDKYGCRHLMYFSCIFLFLAGFIGFFLSTIFSVLLPPITWGCSYLDVALGSDSGFKSNFYKVLGTSTTDKLAPCMPFGDGNIVNSIVTGPAQNAINNLTSIINTMGSFNATSLKASISGNLSTFMATVRTWCKGEVVDLDSTNFAILQNLANPTLWTGCGGNFSTDSWVPSNSQNSSYSTISCRSTTGQVGDSTTCTAALADNGGNQCSGCMNSASLSTIITSGANLGTALSGPGIYGAGCSTFSTSMSNVWNNYYIPKKTYYGPTDTSATGTGVLHRAQHASTLILSTSSPGVFDAIDKVSNKFSSIQTAMTSILNFVDPKYGMVAGLNCKLFGEDFNRIQNVLCGSMYYNLYVMRYAIGISCYGVLFAMCCIVCTGVRHYKHGDRKAKVGDAFVKGHEKSSGELLRNKDA